MIRPIESSRVEHKRYAGGSKSQCSCPSKIQTLAKKKNCPRNYQSGIVYESIEDRPAGTLANPTVISAITAAI